MVFKKLSSLNSATLSCFNLVAAFTSTLIEWETVLSLVFQVKQRRPKLQLINAYALERWPKLLRMDLACINSLPECKTRIREFSCHIKFVNG